MPEEFEEQVQTLPPVPENEPSTETLSPDLNSPFSREEVKALVRNVYKESLGEMQASLKAEEASQKALETISRTEEGLTRVEAKLDQMIELLTTPEVLEAELSSREKEAQVENRENSNGTTQRKRLPFGL